MATPYIKNDGVNYKIQGGLPSGGVDTLQFTDSASSFIQTVPAATGTLALTTIATGVNALVTTDMATAYRALDGLVLPNVKGYLTNTPPGSPADGDCYIIGAAPTGVWAGQAGKVTRYSSVTAGWEFYAPKNGWLLQANSARETYRYTGAVWEIYYQEGTWSPALVGATGSLGTYAASIAVGSFTKIGRSIFVMCYLNVTDKGSWTGNTRVANLPFTSKATSNSYGAVSIGLCTRFVLSAGYTQMAGYVNVNSTNIEFAQSGSNQVAATIDYATLGATPVAVSLSATYEM